MDTPTQAPVAQIGCRIRQLRLHRGMTQTEMARAVDRSRADLSRVERGRRIPTVATFEKAAEALDVSPQTLLLPEKEWQVFLIQSDPYGRSLLHLLRRLSPAQTQAVLDSVKCLGER